MNAEEPVKIEDFINFMDWFSMDKSTNIDASPSPERRLHPTHRKCACGLIFSSRTRLINHLILSNDYVKHGEVLLHEDEV